MVEFQRRTAAGKKERGRADWHLSCIAHSSLLPMRGPLHTCSNTWVRAQSTHAVSTPFLHEIAQQTVVGLKAPTMCLSALMQSYSLVKAVWEVLLRCIQAVQSVWLCGGAWGTVSLHAPIHEASGHTGHQGRLYSTL